MMFMDELYALCSYVTYSFKSHPHIDFHIQATTKVFHNHTNMKANHTIICDIPWIMQIFVSLQGVKHVTLYQMCLTHSLPLISIFANSICIDIKLATWGTH